MIIQLAQLRIPTEQFQQICTHAEQAYPNECCGLLMGQQRGEQKILVEIIPTENAWDENMAEFFEETAPQSQLLPTQERRYTISPEVLLQAQKQGRDRHLAIIGIYHSHPNQAAIPSEFDRRCAWSGYSYLIVSVQHAQAVDVQNWSLDPQHQFQPEEILRK